MPDVVSKKPIASKNLWAALSYVWVLCIVILLVKRDPFIHRHAKQGLLLFIGECIVFIPLLGLLFGWLLSFVAFVMAVFGFIKALNGEEWSVPFIGEWWDGKINI